MPESNHRPSVLPRSVAAVAIGLGTIGCSSVIRDEDWSDADRFRTDQPVATDARVDPLDPEAVWGVGDRVVYAVELDDGGTRHAWTFRLSITALPPPDFEMWDSADAASGRLRTRTAELGCMWYGDELRYACYSGTATVRGELHDEAGVLCDRTMPMEAIAHLWVCEPDLGTGFGVFQVVQTLLAVDCLQSQLLAVVRAPSMWSVIRNFGHIGLTLDYHWDAAETFEAETPFGRLATRWVPVTIDANGEPALDCRVQFAPKHSPLLVAAGVLRIEAVHPDDPTRRLSIRLIEATRGTPPTEPADDAGWDGLRIGMSRAELEQAMTETTTLIERGEFADGTAVEVFGFGPDSGCDLHAVLAAGLLAFIADPLSVASFLRLRGYQPAVTPMVSRSARAH